ncbi:MAG: glutamate--tRNA ligase [Gaiellales bacterium]
MVRVRFAPSPTGALHLGGALTAVANSTFAEEAGGVLMLRIDDTDAARSDASSATAIVSDLRWLGVSWDEGPILQSERQRLYAEAAERLVEAGHASCDGGAVRLDAAHRPTLLRADGRATYHLASVVDDVDLGVTHVIRGRDHQPNTELHVSIAGALGAEPPQYIHHGLIVGSDGRKLSKRGGASSLAELRAAGIPAEAVRAYLKELGMPRHDVRLDRGRIDRLSVDAISSMGDAELAARVGVPDSVVGVLRGARNLNEATRLARQVVDEPEPLRLDPSERPSVEQARELLNRTAGTLDQEAARQLLGEIRALGGDLRTLRRALTGAERGPELWAVLVALGRERALARLDRSLERAGA